MSTRQSADIKTPPAAAPKLAKARLLLAEAFEKKGDKSTAVKYYKEYLEVDPNAPDKQKILKKIEKLGRIARAPRRLHLTKPL